jgi:3-dehydroquinate synthase
LKEFLGNGSHLFVITTLPVRKRWGKKLLTALSGSGFQATVLEIPDGERYKKLATVEALAEKLVRAGADRQSVLIAFGGGVVGDMTGLLASLYMRGVSLVQVPTTVLAQVDASVGGKTGVNLKEGKNLLGAFHHPRVVVIDPAVLSTLSPREFRAGVYEALKCGIIGNTRLFEQLERISPKNLQKDTNSLEWVITQAVKLKAEIVSADEREHGLRRVLNLGHTIGHALEAETQYRRFLHGEAVAWGMIAVAHIAKVTGRINPNSAKRLTDAVLALGPLPKVQVKGRNILKRLQADKKTKNSVVHFVLPVEIGKVEIVDDVPEAAILEAVDVLRDMAPRNS